MTNKSIIIYYTESGNTKTIAELIQKQTKSDICEIKTQKPYPQEYRELLQQAQKEINENYKPPIQKINFDITQYTRIYIGTPVWWGTYAPPLTSFLSENNLNGKEIVPFITHGGGGKGRTDSELKKLCNESIFLNPLVVSGTGGSNIENIIKDWLNNI